MLASDPFNPAAKPKPGIESKTSVVRPRLSFDMALKKLEARLKRLAPFNKFLRARRQWCARVLPHPECTERFLSGPFLLDSLAPRRFPPCYRQLGIATTP